MSKTICRKRERAVVLSFCKSEGATADATIIRRPHQRTNFLLHTFPLTVSDFLQAHTYTYRRTRFARLQTPVAGDSSKLMCCGTVPCVCSGRQLIIPDPYVIRFAANRSAAMVMLMVSMVAGRLAGYGWTMSLLPSSVFSHFSHPPSLSLSLSAYLFCLPVCTAAER